MTPPSVSIILPCWNAEKVVATAIRSILGQTYIDWELVAVDDGSTDGTRNLLVSCSSKEPRLHLIRKERQEGAAAARNAGLRVASGRFLMFLDADDWWLPGKIENQLKALRDGAGMVFSPYWAWSQQRSTVVGLVDAPAQIRYKDLLWRDPIGCLTVAYDRNAWEDCEAPLLWMRNDWALWMRLLRQGREAVRVDEPDAVLRLHRESLTADKTAAARATYRLLRTEGGQGPGSALWGVLVHNAAAVGRRIRRQRNLERFRRAKGWSFEELNSRCSPPQGKDS